MNIEPREEKFCKKITYGNRERPTILLGLVINDVGIFIEFQTAKNKIMISKNSIISIEDTKEIFRGVIEDD